jgi:flavin-dependent dehydrogenase
VSAPGALIVGGGPAGAALALRLAGNGASPLLVERQRETGDALCGGFLSWRTLASLAALGVAADDLNRDRVTRLRLFAGGRQAEATLPAPALGVSRRRLDSLLLARAAAAGAAIERGVAVRAIEGDRVRTADGADLTAGALFLASGKHDVRGLARPAAARGPDPTLGLRLRLAPAAPLAAMLGGTIELHLFRGGYAGIVLQEDGGANICLAVHRSRLAAAGSSAALLAESGDEAPALGDRLAFTAGDTPIEAIANVPYGWRERRGTAGLFRLGDQAGVIASLAGEGMGIALASAASAAAAYARGGAGAATHWQPAFARRLARPLAIAGAGRTLAEGGAGRFLPPLARLPGLVSLIARATRVGEA